MRLVTIGSLGASAALGLGALIVARLLLPASTGHAMAAARIVVSPMADAVPVVVAADDIAFGKRLEAQNLKLIQVPKSAAPAGAFASIDQVLAQDHGGAPVTLTALTAREPILPAKLSGPGARPTIAAQIDKGLRAYAIAVTEVSGVGGHALPGDRVDVVLTRDVTGEGKVKAFESQVVIQNVRVLGVGLNADQASTKPETAPTATLEVSMRDAEKLAMAAQLGALSLVLRPAGASEIEDAPVLTSASLGGPARTPRARGPQLAAVSHIQVVEGEGAPAKKTP